VALAVLASVASCERVDARRQPQLWHASKVGDRGTGLTLYTATLQGPDGTSHTIDNHSEYASETLELDGDYPTRARMTFVRDDQTVDGVTKPGLSGTYEVTEKPDGTLDVARTDGPLDPAAREVIQKSHHGSRTAMAAVRKLAQRIFEPGEVLNLSPDEVTGLGFGMSQVRLTVRSVTPTAVTFEMNNVAELPGVGTLEASGTLTMTEHGRDLDQVGVVRYGGKQIGTVHIVQRSQSSQR
jgi:hypothetical protein